MALTRLKSPEAGARWLESWVRGTLRTDSRQVQPGDAFIAWPGHRQDGRAYVRAALAAGAATCLVEREGVEAFGLDDARVATLPALKSCTGAIAHAFFGRPSEALQLIASTGTNGKTSTAWWTAQALSALGRRCGVIGTLGVGMPPDPAQPELDARLQSTGLTTPDPVALHAALRRFADDGAQAVALEASSIGLVEHRLDGVRLDVALFTNFTPDHLDYHGSMDAYWAAKRLLFGWPGLRAAAIHVGDPQGAALAAELAGGGLELWTVALDAPARLSARGLHYADGGLAFEVVEQGPHAGEEAPPQPVRSRLIGDYNVANVLVVLGGLRALGVPLADAVATVPGLTPVPGRMQRVGDGRGAPEVVVDYAHTPDALDKVLASLRPLADARGGRLWAVFGCGGNRDASKRAPMGAIAEQRADCVVLTTDNPRHEDPQAILAQIRAGLARPEAAGLVVDRRQAITQALHEADAADVVLIAGKGHEDYQDVAGVRHPFDDVSEAARALRERAR